MKATAKAHANIALTKYWGKRDSVLNLPAVGSISLTLNELFTITRVEFSDAAGEDRLHLDNRPATREETLRVSKFMDLVRRKAGISLRAQVFSRNNFPTGAGLASSASAFAALALAATRAANLDLNPAELSGLARRGSGSAARSVFGGFVEMAKGSLPDGSDAVARQIAPPDYWEIRLIILITTEEPKSIGSTEAMELTARTSPFYPQWIASSEDDLREMRQAIRDRAFAKLGEIAEHNCLKMHAVAMAARPGIIYWNPATLRLMQAVREMRASGLPVYFTIDAGPQVKVLCPAEQAAQVAAVLAKVEGVERIIVTGPGPGAHLVEEEI